MTLSPWKSLGLAFVASQLASAMLVLGNVFRGPELDWNGLQMLMVCALLALPVTLPLGYFVYRAAAAKRRRAWILLGGGLVSTWFVALPYIPQAALIYLLGIMTYWANLLGLTSGMCAWLLLELADRWRSSGGLRSKNRSRELRARRLPPLPSGWVRGGEGPRLLVIYAPASDAQAGVARWLLKQRVYGSIEVQPGSGERARRCLPTLDPDRLRQDLHVVGDRGRVWAGRGAWWTLAWCVVATREEALRYQREGTEVLAGRLLIARSRVRSWRCRARNRPEVA